MAFVGFNIIGGLGLDLTLKCVTAVTASAQGIYSLISSISSNKHEPTIGKLLEELDINVDVCMLETMMKEFNVEKHYTKTLSFCLKELEKCLKEIEKILHEIKLRLDYNDSLWVSSFRAYTFTDIIDKLKSLKKTLDNRKNNLFEVIKINEYLNIDTERKELMELSKIMDAEVL